MYREMNKKEFKNIVIVYFMAGLVGLFLYTGITIVDIKIKRDWLGIPYCTAGK